MTMIKKALILTTLLITTLTHASENKIPKGFQAFFSPGEGICRNLLETINVEQGSIKIAIFTFTHQEIKKALIQAKHRGALVEVIIDQQANRKSRLVEDLVKANIDVYAFETSSPKKRPLMHHKFCLLGKNKRVWTGSFNFTYKADRENYENIILIEDEELYSSFQTQFENLKYKCKKIYAKN